MPDDRFRQQAEDFITETLAAEIPDIATDPGSGVSNILVRGGGVIHAALHQEIEHTLSSRDISDPEAISDSDMDRNLEPLLVDRDNGEFSAGHVNIHFAERKARTISQGTRAQDSDKTLTFLTETDLSYVESDYIVEPSDNSFYLRIPFKAEKAGPEYDLDVGEINVLVDNRLGALYVRNAEVFVGGQPAQTNTEFLSTAKRAVSTRIPINLDGTILTLQKMFGTKLLDALIVGNGDPEMLRDELYSTSGVMSLGPSGTPTGIHIGGRTDTYHWYPQVNYVQVDIDLTIDLVANTSSSIGAATIQSKFAAGTTSSNTVPSSGSLVLELGGANEETVQYSAVTFNSLTGIYTFTLVGVTTKAHAASSAVKVAGNGEISVGVNGAIKVLPILKVASVRVLDPLTLTPIGSPLNKVTAGDRDPGWYFSNQNKLDFMSAKETRTLKIDEKRLVAGNTGIDVLDGVMVSSTKTLTSATANFTGFQGRAIRITGIDGDINATIIQVVDAHTVVLSDESYNDESLLHIFIAPTFGDFLQYPIRIGFYTHTEIQEAQNVFDSGRIRVLCSNILSRAFLPLFLDFTLRFKGSGSVASVRTKLLELIQAAQGDSLGANQGARFDVSDIIAAPYDGGLASFVETPFQIKITQVNIDGTETIKYVSPNSDTVGELIIATAATAGGTTVTTTRSASVDAFTVPSKGKLFLGSFIGNEEIVTFDSVIFSGSNMIFVLTEGTTLQYNHGLNEPLRVSVLDYDPDNVITDGVISAERQFRPYFGTVVVEKIE